MTTIAVTARTAAQVVEIARQGCTWQTVDGPRSGIDSTCVTWGLPGAGHDGFDILAADDAAAVERLQRAVRFGQQRISGRKGCRVVWGTHTDVLAHLEAEREAERQQRRSFG
jgi:hypothetical protein